MSLSASLKSAGRRLFRPIWRRMWFRIERRVAPLDAQIATLRDEVEALRQQANRIELHANQVPILDSRLAALDRGWRQHIPSLLNAISSVAAHGHELSALRREIDSFPQGATRLKALEKEWRDELSARVSEQLSGLWKSTNQASKDIGELWSRLEFVRKEIMYEMSFGLKNASAASEAPTQILSPEKVSAARASGIRINLGCGHISLDDYINIDQRNLPGVDIVSEVASLPFEKESVQEIRSAHLLEHFPQERLRRLLSYWHSLLAPDGAFIAIVPDGDAMVSGMAQGTYPFDEFREVLFGAQEYSGDFHFNLMTPASLADLLSETGFTRIEVPARGRRNGNCFEFEIHATRG